MSKKKLPFESDYNKRTSEKHFIIEQALNVACAYIASSPRLDMDEIQHVISCFIIYVQDIHFNYDRLINDNVAPVSVKDSRHPEYIICLEDGTKHKVLRRYLASKFGMTPNEYINKWKLPPDYRLTSLNYEKRRKEMTQQLHNAGKLKGRKKRNAA